MSLPEHIKANNNVEPEGMGALKGSEAAELTGLIGIVTKYNENELVGTHTTVWGSFFCTETKKWGFKCCLSLDKVE